MIITEITKVNTGNISDYAWNRITQFHNSDFTTSLIARLHQLDKKQHPNARKQAEQIKCCLIQAREYFQSARAVSLATKPVLLYYCVMSLALAEALLKQSGESRLGRLRAEHNCHGLTLGLTADPTPTDTFSAAALKMVATTQRKDALHAKGTFEIWRRSAREYPIAGSSLTTVAGGQLTKFEMLMVPEDKAPPDLGGKPISLYTCIVNLPYMADVLRRWGTQLQMVRSTISREIDSISGNTFLSIIVHPNSPDLIDKFGSLFRAQASLINSIDISELASGYALRVDAKGGHHFSLPHGTTIFEDETYFACSTENLGEFGFLYAALHMLGNFSRYYPDMWVKHIEMNSPLANVVDELCRSALDRLPLLILSELTRSYHVLEK